MNYTKQTTYRSEAWRRAVAALACVECGSNGTQAAHRNEGKGMSIKTDDCLTAALCPTCHVEIDSGCLLSRDERRQRMDRAILKTLAQLARAGKISPTEGKP
jgi:ferredoxin